MYRLGFRKTRQSIDASIRYALALGPAHRALDAPVGVAVQPGERGELEAVGAHDLDFVGHACLLCSDVEQRQADQLERDYVGAEPPRDPDAIGPDYRDYLEPTPDSIEIAREDIVPIRARPEGIANARKFMAQAARGEMPKRGPLTVKDNGDGSYTLLDGNSTYAIATEAGMETLPVRVVTDEQFAQEVAEKNAEKMLELGPSAKKKRVVLAQDLAPVDLERLAATLQSRQAYASIDDIVERNNIFNVELNAAVERAAGEHDVKYHPGPAKKRKRIEDKVQTKYAGDLNQIADASRATVTVTRPTLSLKSWVKRITSSMRDIKALRSAKRRTQVISTKS
jgi:hypothetical protein